MDLPRKAHFIACGHTTDPPNSMTCDSAVSRESVRITLLLVSLNNVELITGNIAGAHIHTPTTEKLVHRVGGEYGSIINGTVLVMVRALYGIKTSINACRTYICTILKHNRLP